MYGPLNRELIKELKLLVLSAEPAWSHTNSHIILIQGILLSVSLNNGGNAARERQMSLPVLAGVSAWIQRHRSLSGLLRVCELPLELGWSKRL